MAPRQVRFYSSLPLLLKGLCLPRGAISFALEHVSKAILLDIYRIWLRRGGNVDSGGKAFKGASQPYTWVASPRHFLSIPWIVWAGAGSIA
jgi:hypothetical protein